VCSSDLGCGADPAFGADEILFHAMLFSFGDLALELEYAVNVAPDKGLRA